MRIKKKEIIIVVIQINFFIIIFFLLILIAKTLLIVAHNVWRYETLRISKHKLFRPLSRWLNIISFKNSTIRAMFYYRVLATVVCPDCPSRVQDNKSSLKSD